MGLRLMEEGISSIISVNQLDVRPDTDIVLVRSAMIEHGSTEAYVVSEERTYLGKLHLRSLILADRHDTIMNLMDKDALSIKSDASLQQAIKTASNFIGETIPIIERETNMFIGTVSEGDIFKLYLELQGQTIDLKER